MENGIPKLCAPLNGALMSCFVIAKKERLGWFVLQQTLSQLVVFRFQRTKVHTKQHVFLLGDLLQFCVQVNTTTDTQKPVEHWVNTSNSTFVTGFLMCGSLWWCSFGQNWLRWACLLVIRIRILLRTLVIFVCGFCEGSTFGNPTPDLRKLLNFGVRFAFGTDNMMSNSPDMFREMVCKVERRWRHLIDFGPRKRVQGHAFPHREWLILS